MALTGSERNAEIEQMTGETIDDGARARRGKAVRRVRRMALAGAAILALSAGGARAGLVNGDFSAGLGGWTPVGDASATATHEALLRDDAAGFGATTLFQGASLASGTYELSFDFLASVSTVVPFGDFPDLFAATLYFSDASTFDPNNVDAGGNIVDLGDSLALLDVDNTGLILDAGAVAASPKGSDWRRYTAPFALSFSFAVPTFDLFDGNFLADSSVQIDNVQITAVPEPGTVVLLLTALGMVAMRGSRGARPWTLGGRHRGSRPARAGT